MEISKDANSLSNSLLSSNDDDSDNVQEVRHANLITNENSTLTHNGQDIFCWLLLKIKIIRSPVFTTN